MTTPTASDFCCPAGIPIIRLCVVLLLCSIQRASAVPFGGTAMSLCDIAHRNCNAIPIAAHRICCKFDCRPPSPSDLKMGTWTPCKPVPRRQELCSHRYSHYPVRRAWLRRPWGGRFPCVLADALFII